MKKEKWFEKPDIYQEKIDEIRVKCPICGHTMVMPVFVDDRICSHCKNKVFNNTKLHFIYKLRNDIKKENKANEKS